MTHMRLHTTHGITHTNRNTNTNRDKNRSINTSTNRNASTSTNTNANAIVNTQKNLCKYCKIGKISNFFSTYVENQTDNSEHNI